MMVKSLEARVQSQTSWAKRDAGMPTMAGALKTRFGSRLAPCSLTPDTRHLTPSRRGITLTEVLISMGLMTLGLLGVMSLFPVGSFYMQQAEIADRGSAIGRSVMSDLVARGMLDPKAWQMYAPAPAVPTADVGPVNTFSRPVGPAMAVEMAAMAVPVPDPRPMAIAKRYGSAYVIDPMGLAAVSVPGSDTIINAPMSAFPAEAFLYPVGGVYATTEKWDTWLNVGPANVRGALWPIRRVTFHQANSNPMIETPSVRMDARTAEMLFSNADDVVFEHPGQDDRPAIQTWQVNSSGAAISRQWVGDYSWIVTVAPTSGPAQLAISTSPDSYAYDVSVVVFYKRPVGRKSPTVRAEAIGPLGEIITQERALRGRVVSTGLNGGELRLEQLGAWTGPSPYDSLRAGQWLMICGPHPSSSDQSPRFVLNWYQVQAIDKEGVGVVTDAAKQRLVTLRGPEWPWQPAPAPGGLDDTMHLSNDLCVGIFPGAVAVHTKTLRLEGAHGSLSGAASSNPAAAANPIFSLR